MTEVVNTVIDMFHQLGVLSTTCNQALSDMSCHLDSPQQLPQTRLASTQPESVLTCTKYCLPVQPVVCVCVCATPVPKGVGFTVSAVMSAGGQRAFLDCAA